MVPVYSWTGAYIGANLGAHFGTDSTTTATDAAGFGAAGAASIDSLTPGSVKLAGLEGGGQVGFNLQFSPIVVGFEADAQWLGGSATRTIAGFGGGLAAGDQFTTAANSAWLTTFRGRLGAAFNRALLYVTGGGAYSFVNFTDSFGSFGNTSIATVSNNSGVLGWTVGGGLEWALSENWTARGEYLYVNFGSVNTSVPSCAACGAGSDITVTHKYTESLARAGLNYKFGGMY